MSTYGFHPEALAEYTDAANFYLKHASALIAAAFVAEIETSIANILMNPEVWRVVEAPGIRRHLSTDSHTRFTIDGNRSMTGLPFTRSCICIASRATGSTELRDRSLPSLIPPDELEESDGITHGVDAADFVGVNRGDRD
jgi:plasmid stabilization system protein ParE